MKERVYHIEMDLKILIISKLLLELLLKVNLLIVKVYLGEVMFLMSKDFNLTILI